MKINLTHTEYRIAKFLGHERYKNARKKGVEDLKKGGQSNAQTDIDGMAVELAVAKGLNTYPDLDIADELPDQDGFLHDGRSYDAKATRVKEGHLIVALHKIKIPCDIYIHGVIDELLVDIQGFYCKQEIFDDWNIKELIPGKPCYAIKSDRLHNVERLAQIK